MSGIRALERADLPAVCALFEQVMGSGSRTPDPRLPGYFERIFFDDPWADPELPSLVYEGPDGEIVGFIGSNARRLRLDGRPIRMAVSSNMVVHPDWRPRGLGALILRYYLRGPQELTIADRANDSTRQMWLGLGGEELVHASVGWYRVFRPGAMGQALVSRRGRDGRDGVVRRGAQLAAGPIDTLARRVPAVGARLAPTEPDGAVEPLTPDALLEQMSGIGRRLRLYPDYDAAFLRWLFGELDALRGRVVARLVRAASGQVLGWFVYLLPEGGVAVALQVGVAGRDPDVVLDHLLADAHREGAAAVHGRLEPATSGILARPGVLVRRSARALVHCEDAGVLGLLGSTKSLLSHLDGEWVVSHARRL